MIKALFFAILISASVSKSSADDVYIKVNVGEAKIKKSLLAIPPFQLFGSPAQSKNSQGLGNELYNTVLNDLDVSSYFQFINQAAYLEDTKNVGLKPAPGEPNGFNYENWKK